MVQDENVVQSELSSFFLSCNKVVIARLPKLTIFSCHYTNTRYTQRLFKEFDIYFPNSLQRSVVKRQAEYFAGRYMAKLALSALGIENTKVSTGIDRAPSWPIAINGSISHTHNTAYSAVGTTADFDYIGIDFEEFISPSTSKDIASIIINPHEQIRLASYNLKFEIMLTLIFSAKESLFKALYQRVNEYFDFSAAEFVSITGKDNQFVIQLTRSLCSGLPKGKRFIGHFEIMNNHVLTVIAGSL
ncbi:4'-phosphopantetheinyl transferase [Marinomonas primoryensis]|jgi:enterobactin synthetase component D|uniref:4'-phosphopantetheinyl transferase family protein n=1 Tax=Marinomonas primoryensis TaxID=178399 RepID=UPI0037046016